MPVARPALALLAVALPALAALAATDRAHAAPLDTVCADMQAEAAAFDGRVGFVALDLTDWTRCSYHSDEIFITASLYKLVVLAEAYRQQELGTFSFDEPISVYRPPLPDDEDSTGTIVSMSSAEAARLMIQLSDNDAAEALRARLDKPTVAALPPQLGMPNTILGQDFTTTASDIAHYFAQLNAGRLISADSDAAMRELLLGQEINDRMPWFLPDDVPIAHKTGRLDRLAHDAGIVYAPGGPYVLVLLTEGAVSQEQGFEAIRSLAALSYTAYAEPRPPAAAVLPPFLDPGVTEGADVLAAAATLRQERAARDAQETAALVTAQSAEPPQATAAEGAAPPVELSVPPAESPWWQTQTGRIGLLSALALVPLAVLVLRPRRRPRPPEPALDAMGYRADRPVLARVMAGDSTMRIRDSGKGTSEAAEPAAERRPAPIGASGENGFAVTSPRLQRLSAYFRAQLHLLEEMSQQLEAETSPLLALLARQSRTVEQVLVNLDDRLGPLREYNEHEEANLEALEDQIDADGMDFIARSFSDYVTQQHRRISETRRRIDAQREPFEQLALDQRDSVELALERFDADIEALEGNLDEQRRVLTRLLDAMRSEDFTEVTEYLVARQQALSEAASLGVTDPAEIALRMRELRHSHLGSSNGSAHLDRVLEGLEEADERLIETSERPSVRALERPQPEPLHEDEEAASRERTTA